MRMTFRGKEDVPTETIQTPMDENWYQDLKEVPSIALPEKALVGAGMSLNWRMHREDRPVYTEDGKGKAERWLPLLKKPDEELWYHCIVQNFVPPRDADLSFQPTAGAGKPLPYLFFVYFFCTFELVILCALLVGELSNLGIGLEKRKRAPTATAVPKKNDAEKAQSSKAKNFGGEKKGMHRSSDFGCDYVVVSDSLEGLAPVVIIRRPKPEPKETADIPPSNPDDPIDLESSPEYLVRNKAGKRKQSGAEAEGQPAKKVQRKKITRRGNLDAFISESAPSKCYLFVFS
ncbi:hypothetical protein HanRHA438_Chr13g0592751 [Helianthus annuus]|nr:hypothetical protein HanPSC8_Chr13g0560131 [Helianthus annuus]KAJ0857664.1 hypothetical protein HanRHA438_Chr13g0592751 [Helianthus annuus]